MIYAKRKKAAIVEAEKHGHSIVRQSEVDTRWAFQGRCRKCKRTIEVPRVEGGDWFKARSLVTTCVPH